MASAQERKVSPAAEMQELNRQASTTEFVTDGTRKRIFEFVHRMTGIIEQTAGGRETGAVNPLSTPSTILVDATKSTLGEITGGALAAWLEPQGNLRIVSNSQDSVRTCISLDFETEGKHPDGINMTIVDYYFDGHGPRVTFDYSPFRYPRFQQPDEEHLILQNKRKKVVNSMNRESELRKLNLVAQFLGRVVESLSPQQATTF